MESVENITSELDISNIFYAGQIIFFVIIIIAIIVIVILAKKKGKHFRLKKINIGPFETVLEEDQPTLVPVHSIAILRQPASVSGNPAILNTLKVRVYDRNGNPLRNKLVTVSIDGKEDETERYITGQLCKKSDENGYVIFSDISVLRRGSFYLTFHADNVTAKARPFDVMPPGLDTNFENKEFGSEEYIDTLQLAISLNKGADKVSINDEEIK